MVCIYNTLTELQVKHATSKYIIQIKKSNITNLQFITKLKITLK